MNILTDALPQSVKIGDKEYRIKTDYRDWIKFYQTAFSGNSDGAQLAKIICSIYIDVPRNLSGALKAMLDFYTIEKKGAGTDDASNRLKVFDFDCDSWLIYAAFLQQYRIDLTEVKMHWWTFKTLLDNLSEDTLFVKVMQFRCKDISKIKDKEMRQYYLQMKRRYALPDNRTEKEKENAFANDLAEML